jgi:SAM-dependent methyltransferase
MNGPGALWRRSCPACDGEAEADPVSVREMMFGSRERYDYNVCAGCGSAWLADVPADLARHYRGRYHSFSVPAAVSPLGRFFKARRAAHVLGSPNLLGALALRAWGSTEYLEWCRRVGVGQRQRVLDVGCGRGHLLVQMHAAGFRRLAGLDPFLEADVHPAQGLTLHRCELSAVDGPFDLVMLHHSLEHMPDVPQALRHVRRLLPEGGWALVRLPVTGGHAMREYGADWVQWDAPRHLFIPSRRGMEGLAASAGLRVEEVVYDSTGLQFWGSEMYRHGVPLDESGEHLSGGSGSLFTAERLREYEARARELNRAEDGDQACFFLRAA